MRFQDITSNILCKATPTREELEARAEHGFYWVELHIEPKFVYDCESITKSIENVLKSGVDVKGIHMPLVHNKAINTGIPEFCISNSGDNIYNNTLILAQSLADELGHSIYIVYHSMHSPDTIKGMGNIWDDILFYFNHRLSVVPNITYTFESTTPIDETGSFVSGSGVENVLMCKALRDEFGSDKFFTTFDTCHALITERIYEALKGATGNIKAPTFESMFKSNIGLMNNIHFSYAKNFGATGEEHGISHDMNDIISKEHFNKCMELIESIDKPYPYLTLEVNEDDYSNPINMIQQYHNIWGYYIGIPEEYDL